MDRRQLHDHGGNQHHHRQGEAGGTGSDQDMGAEARLRSFVGRGFRSAGNPPRETTGSAAGSDAGVGPSPYRHLNLDAIRREAGGSFDDDAPFLASDAAHMAAGSWDELSDDEKTRRLAQIDRRKFVDATTPTLADEDEEMFDGDREGEEQEIVSLERERLVRSGRVFFGSDESMLRRTPGAQMYRSAMSQQPDDEGMRRTPGATQMHRSLAAGVRQPKQQQPQQHHQQQQDTRPLSNPETTAGPASDTSGLGFGLTLASPIAASERAKAAAKNSSGVSWEGTNVSATASSRHSPQKVNRPPMVPGSSASGKDPRGSSSFLSAWSLPQQAPGSLPSDSQRIYSPNTLRLSADLGNLLLEDDDQASESADPSKTTSIGTSVIGSKSETSDAKPSALGAVSGESADNWMASYVIGTNSPSKIPRNVTGRNRRGKSETGRRARSQVQDRASQIRPQNERTSALPGTGGFLPHAQQPTPIRSTQPMFSATLGEQFTFGETNRSKLGDRDDRSSPRLLNFGGAFAPPSSNFMRPIPSSAGADVNPGPFNLPQFLMPQDLSRQNPFQPPGGAPSFVSGFQNPQSAPPAQSFVPQAPKFQPQFTSQDQRFGHSPNPDPNPTFTFQAPNVGPYPMPQRNLQATPPEFVTFVPVHPHQPPRAPIPQFASQGWQQQPIPVHPQTVDRQNWRGPGEAVRASSWAPGGDFGYSAPASQGGLGLSVTPTPPWTPDVGQKTHDASVNPFSVPDQQTVHSGRTSSSGRTSRNQNRSRNQRRNSSRRSKAQNRVERGNKPESQSVSAKKPAQLAGKGKKKQAKDGGTPPVGSSPAHGSAPNEETGASSTAEDVADAKRAELTESPATRSAFKDFYRKFRAEERNSFQDAETFAVKALSDGSLPESVHWRIYLELADLAKRANKFPAARQLYQQVCRLQPYASQGWLEYSKLEEECGNMRMCAKILGAGLEYCEYSENLLTRAIKHEEKMGNLNHARGLLARLKHVGIEKVWRTVLEGALLEARAGNDTMARRVLKYLMHHVPWYGPLYLEAYRLERDLGRTKEALAIVERGLSAIPRYGPLWFGSFRLCEAMDHASGSFHLPKSMAMIDRATSSISKELVWKVHLEAAQMLERASFEVQNRAPDSEHAHLMIICRQRFAMTILTCPPNLRWKVWLASGRMEVSAGRTETARTLFLRAHQVVPEKSRAVALLECARLEEFVGDVELASAILCKSRAINGSDWKIWLESVLLEIRGGDYARAIEIATLALKTHTGTGRLWASLVSLRHFEGGEEAQFEALKLALNAVPKSGEVWCEGSRIHLNPFCRSFSTSSARRHLAFATKFTPQYGDGFLESLRLEILDQWLKPISRVIWKRTEQHLKYGPDTAMNDSLGRFMVLIFGVVRMLCGGGTSSVSEGPVAAGDLMIDEGMANEIRANLSSEHRDATLNIRSLELCCANADPNYGLLWFHCRCGPTDTARDIVSRALDVMRDELGAHAHIYLFAYLRRFAVLKGLAQQRGIKGFDACGDTSDFEIQNLTEREEIIEGALLAAPSLEAIIELGNKDETLKGMDLLESTMTGSDFVTGLVQLSRQRSIANSLPERRKALFGTDALF